MLLDNIPLLSALRGKMVWLNERQSVIAQNVANANAPGYKAQDLKEVTFGELVAGTNKVPKNGATHQSHFQLAAMKGATPLQKIEADTDWEATPDGNSVVLEEQMMKIAETQMEYQSVTSLYKKSLDIMRMAIRSK